MMARLGIGDKAPTFEMQAVVSQRAVGLPRDAGRVLVLIFHDQNGTDVIEPVNSVVRRALYSAEDVLVASVVNLRSVPSLLRPMVGKIVERAYHQAAEHVPERMDSADYIVILLDWDGQVTRRYGVDGRPSVVVVDQDGDIAAYHRGGDLPAAVAEILPHLLPPPADAP